MVIKFLSMPQHHPAQQLEAVRGIRSHGRLTPFAQLDALYRHIFSLVEDIPKATSILAWSILSKQRNLRVCAEFFAMREADIYVLFASLKSVVDLNDDKIQFFHASLPDFLLDQNRSQEYYIDHFHWSTLFSIRAFRLLASKGHLGVSDVSVCKEVVKSHHIT